MGVPQGGPSWGPARVQPTPPLPPPSSQSPCPHVHRCHVSGFGLLRLSPLAASQSWLAGLGSRPAHPVLPGSSPASQPPDGRPPLCSLSPPRVPAWLPGCRVDPNTTHPPGVGSSTQAVWGESPPKLPAGPDRTLIRGPASALLPCVECRRLSRTCPLPTSQCGVSPVDPHPGFVRMEEARPVGPRTGSPAVLLGLLSFCFCFLKPTTWVCSDPEGAHLDRVTAGRQGISSQTSHDTTSSEASTGDKAVRPAGATSGGRERMPVPQERAGRALRHCRVPGVAEPGRA